MALEPGLGYELHPPKSYTQGRKSGQPTVIFIHTTEGSEGRTGAEDGAAYDARRTDGTSTHFFVDADTVVQCVATTDEAHAARAHGNDVGIQIEVCGKAGQDASQWHDVVSAATLELLAHLCVKLRHKYGAGRFPLVHLTPAQLHAGGRGFAGHIDATRAWPEDAGTHSDPGPNFPWNDLFSRIQAIEKASTTVATEIDPTAAKVWRTDGVLNNPTWRADSPARGGTNVYITAATGLAEAMGQAHAAWTTAADAHVSAAAVEAKVSSLLADPHTMTDPETHPLVKILRYVLTTPTPATAGT